MGSIAEPQKATYGTFRYISKDLTPSESTHFYHLPTVAEFGDVRSLPMTDIRSSLDLGSSSPYKLSTFGFTARTSPTAMSSPPYIHSDWNSEQLLKDVYIPEVEAIVKSLTGAKTVFTDQVVMRNSIHTEVDGLAREEDEEDKLAFPKMVGTKSGSGGSPAPKVHLDYAPEGARTHLRKFHQKTKELSAAIIEAGKSVV